MPSTELVIEQGFRRVLLVHTGERPELDLIDYAALLSSGGRAMSTTVAAYPSDKVLRFRARSPHSLRGPGWAPEGAAPRRAGYGCRLRSRRRREGRSSGDAAPATVREAASHRAARPLGIALLCVPGAGRSAVPYWPHPRRDPPRRIRARVLSQAASLYRCAKAEELIALHSCFHESVSEDEFQHQRFRSERTLDLWRFMARANLPGVCCTPLMEEAANPHRALARVAKERSADLVMVGRRSGSAPRVSAGLLWNVRCHWCRCCYPAPETACEGCSGAFFRIRSRNSTETYARFARHSPQGHTLRR